MSREENVIIFNDTEQFCNENARLKESIARSIARQKMIPEKAAISAANKQLHAGPAQIMVSKKRSFEAASAYKDQKVCVLNFASASNPGGGVERGASAQEECLCRCSSLYFCLNTPKMWNEFYWPHRREQNPLHNDDIIYTPGVTVFKTDTSSPKRMREADWYEVNVITCAAPNLRLRPSNGYNSGDGDRAVRISEKELLALHEKRLRRILDVAINEGNEVVILGAFGCGAFKNDPRVVARAARNVLGEYQKAFKTIEFAVYCSERDEGNYMVFERTLG